MLIDNEWPENLFSIIIIWYVTVQNGRKSYASGLTRYISSGCTITKSEAMPIK